MGKRGPKKGEGGRHEIEIDWVQVGAMAKIWATAKEISAYTGASLTTLNRACIKRNGKTFDAFLSENGEAGKISLRRIMLRRALNDKSPAAAIFMSKNKLGMSDRQDIHMTQTIESTIDWSVYSEDELRTLKALIDKGRKIAGEEKT